MSLGVTDQAVRLVGSLGRPLAVSEQQRARTLADAVERDIIRRWPGTPARVKRGELSPLDLADIIAWMVIPHVVGPEVPGAKSVQVTSGSESRAVTFDAVGNPRDPWVYADWMRAILDGMPPEDATAGAGPRGSFPDPAPVDYDRLFPLWPEVYP